MCNRIIRKAAYSIDRTTGLFVLEGVSLVNGAQTTCAIGAVYAETPEVISKASVFIQMIDLDDDGEEQATQITKLSNTQNRIDGKDFVSLDPQQDRLRMESCFADAYPAHIFKNVGRLKQLADTMIQVGM